MSLTDKVFQELVKKIREEHKGESWRGTFDEFLLKIAKNPEKYLRTSYQYIRDAILYFGTKEIKDCGEILPHYKVFDDPFSKGSRKIYGQHRVLESIVSEIKSSASEEGPERILLLHGPPGTAKTSIFYLISKAMEAYSRTDEGELLRFRWNISKIPVKKINSSPIGFKAAPTASYASSGLHNNSGQRSKKGKRTGKPSESVRRKDVEMMCSLNDNPLFLIPKKYRYDILSELMGGRAVPIPKKILEGDLCYNCRQIYKALLDKYDGDLEKVFQHVVVERFFVEDNQGFILIEPGTREDPFYMQFKMLSEKISRFLPGVVVQPLGGRWASCNRGFIHFSDIFKSNDNHYQLLSASEEHRVTINGLSVTIDTLIGGTCNIEDYEGIKKNPLSKGLRDRIRRFGVNYVLNFKDEEQIYLRDLKGLSTKHIAPHSVSIAALWAVLTRLDKPVVGGLPENIPLSDEATELLLNLSPMQKAEIYAGKARHELKYFRDDKTKLIDDNFRMALKHTTGLLEWSSDYTEGTFGISPRKIQDLFKRILKKGSCLDPVTVIEGIDALIVEEKGDHDFLSWEEAIRIKFLGGDSKSDRESFDLGDYFNSYKALDIVKDDYLSQIYREVSFAFLDLRPERFDNLVRDYVENVELAVLDPTHVAGKDRSHKISLLATAESNKKPDMELLEEIEGKIGLTDKDEIEEFRRDIISQFHEYVKNFPPKETGRIDYEKALPELYMDIQDALSSEKIKGMDTENIQEAIYRYNTESFNDIEPCIKNEAERIVRRMKEFYGYCDVCAKKTLLYAFKTFDYVFSKKK